MKILLKISLLVLAVGAFGQDCEDVKKDNIELLQENSKLEMKIEFMIRMKEVQDSIVNDLRSDISEKDSVNKFLLKRYSFVMDSLATLKEEE